MIGIAYLLVVIAALVGGEVLGIQQVSAGVKTFALTSSAMMGAISLIIMTVFDAT